MLAQHVCQASSVLHQAGLIHKDIKCPNILQVSDEHFILIDMESVAFSPFRLPEEFWSDEDVLEGQIDEDVYEDGNLYTPMSDMYILGRLLETWGFTSATCARQFAKQLTSKKPTAAMALKHPWLSDSMP
ncbi:unnamed protein product [Sphagnum balticum]